LLVFIVSLINLGIDDIQTFVKSTFKMYVSSWIMVGLCLKNTLLTCNNWFNWLHDKKLL